MINITTKSRKASSTISSIFWVEKQRGLLASGYLGGSHPISLNPTVVHSILETNHRSYARKERDLTIGIEKEEGLSKRKQRKLEKQEHDSQQRKQRQ